MGKISRVPDETCLLEATNSDAVGAVLSHPVAEARLAALNVLGQNSYSTGKPPKYVFWGPKTNPFEHSSSAFGPHGLCLIDLFAFGPRLILGSYILAASLYNQRPLRS